MAGLWEWLRCFVLGSSRRQLLARAEENRAERLREQGPDAPLLQALGGDEPPEPCILVGGTVQTGEPVWLTLRELVGLCVWMVGATGSGKSAESYAWQMPLLRPAAPWAWLLLDAKGEGARFCAEVLLPAVLSGWSAKDQESFFARYRRMDPFDGASLPPGNILAPRPGMAPELHAREAVALITEGLGGRFNDLGARMVACLTYFVSLAIEVGGLSLIEVRHALADERYRLGLARFSRHEATRAYLANQFPKEHPQTVLGLTSRLDLLLYGDHERILAAPGSLDYDALLRRGTALLDLGTNLPLGAGYLQRFYLTQVVRGLVRAVVNRKDTSVPAYVTFDEAWMALDGLEDEIEPLLTVWLRHRRVSLTFINQLPSQVARRAPAVLAALKNSAACELHFRQGAIEDAHAVAHVIPSGHLEYVPRSPEHPWDLVPASASEQRQRGVEGLTRLPDRTFWFSHKKRGLKAALLRSPEIPFDELKRAAEDAPRELRERCMGRSGGHTRAELDDILGRRRLHMRFVADGFAASGTPSLSGTPAMLVPRVAPPSRTVGVQTPTPPPPNRPVSPRHVPPPSPSTVDDKDDGPSLG